jgi:hypothetical protein
MTGNVFGSIRALVAWMRLAWAPVGISVLIFSGVAQARSTPEGPVPDSCVVDAPNGATIIGATGQIVLAGGSTFTPPTCNASWAPTHPPVPGATATVAGGGLAEGWVMDSTAHPIENSGEYIFDDVEAYITVPNAPRNPSDTGQQFIWCGLENLIGGSWITVIQPEITWLDGAWYLQDQWVPNPTYLPGQNFITSPAEQVNPGDTIFCQVWQDASNNWKINAVDENTGAWSLLNYQPGSGYEAYPYNWAQLGVYEVDGLTACDGLPGDNFTELSASKLQQAGPDWNSEVNVLNSVTVNTYQASNCSYYTYWADDLTTFSWAH